MDEDDDEDEDEDYYYDYSEYEDLNGVGSDSDDHEGGNSIDKFFCLNFGLKNGLRFRFDSATFLNYPFLNIFLV